VQVAAYHLPVPVTQLRSVPGAGKVDPVGDKGSDGKEHLPERHDLASDVGRGHLADVDGTSS
jgi:hypothetical protein